MSGFHTFFVAWHWLNAWTIAAEHSQATHPVDICPRSKGQIGRVRAVGEVANVSTVDQTCSNQEVRCIRRSILISQQAFDVVMLGKLSCRDALAVGWASVVGPLQNILLHAGYRVVGGAKDFGCESLVVIQPISKHKLLILKIVGLLDHVIPLFNHGDPRSGVLQHGRLKALPLEVAQRISIQIIKRVVATVYLSYDLLAFKIVGQHWTHVEACVI